MKIGDKVRLRDPDSFSAYVRSKCGDSRVGIVMGFTSKHPGKPKPIVVFPEVGHKSEYILGAVSLYDLELATDPPHGKEGV